MSPRFAWCGLLVSWSIVSCQREALEINFEIPADYDAAITQTRLKVLFPPPDGSLTCESLAFADVDTVVVEASTLQEILVARGHTRDLADVPRTGAKVLWMQGLDALGNIVVQGCSDVGDIGKHTTVAIQAEPTTDVALPPPHLIHQDTFGGNLLLPFTATLRDVYGAPLNAHEVRIRSILGSLSTDTIAITDATGHITVGAELAAHRGPYLLDVRSRWPKTGAKSISGFAAPRDLATFALPGVVPDYALLHSPLGGQALLALLIVPDGGSSEYLRLLRFDTGSPQVAAEVQVYGAEHLAVVEHDGVEWAVTMAPDPTCGPTCWVEIATDGGMAKHAVDASVSRVMAALLPLGDCDASATAGPQLARFADGSLVQMSALGQPLETGLDNIPPLEFRASGCMADSVSVVHRALFAALPAGASPIPAQAIVLPGAALRQGLWPGLANGVGFLPPLGDVPLLAGPASSPDGGISIDVTQLDLSNADVQLHVRESIPTFGPAVELVGANLDADGLADIAAMIATADLQGSGAPVLRLFVALGQRYQGKSIAAAALEQPAFIPRLLVGDFDGDGCADLFVGQRGASPSTVRITSLCP